MINAPDETEDVTTYFLYQVEWASLLQLQYRKFLKDVISILITFPHLLLTHLNQSTSTNPPQPVHLNQSTHFHLYLTTSAPAKSARRRRVVRSAFVASRRRRRASVMTPAGPGEIRGFIGGERASSAPGRLGGKNTSVIDRRRLGPRKWMTASRGGREARRGDSARRHAEPAERR